MHVNDGESPQAAPTQRSAVPPRLRRLALVTAMSVTAINVWTGVPLLGLWAGAQVVGKGGQLSMLAVLVVALVIFAAGLACAKLLAVLSAAHDHLSGHWRPARRRAPWLRSYSGERRHPGITDGAPLAAVDYVVIATVVACCIALEAWFFFASGSSIGGSSGR